MSFAKCLVDAKVSLGETPVWSQEEQKLYWIDCPTSQIHRYDPASGKDQVLPIKIDGYLGSIALKRGGGFIILAGKALWSLGKGESTPKKLIEVEADLSDNVPNDGKCDPAGRFLFGTMHGAVSEPTGSLYSYDGKKLTKLDSGFACSNGMDWSPDGKTLYFVDMMPGRVLAYDYDVATGGVSNRRTLFTVDPSEGMPDGICTDSEGTIWAAHWDGWCLSRWSPQGRLLARYEVPVARPTCPIFGGKDGRTLFLTSAIADLPADVLAKAPLSGGLFSLEVGTKGPGPALFAG